ncbi:MAG: hypothetical protein ACLPID_21115 [Beijerinckiaceae bacterium]
MEQSAERALSAADNAADATYQRLMTHVLDRITDAQIRRARLQGIMIAAAITVIPHVLDHLWLKFEYDRRVDAAVAAQLDSTPEDVKFALRTFDADPDSKQNLTIIQNLEHSQPGFAQWAKIHALQAYELFTYNENKDCPYSFKFRSGQPACAFRDPIGKLFAP